MKAMDMSSVDGSPPALLQQCEMTVSFENQQCACCGRHSHLNSFMALLSLQFRSLAALLPGHYEFLFRLECSSLLKYQIFDLSESSSSGNLQTCRQSYLNSQRNPSLIQAALLGDVK